MALEPTETKVFEIREVGELIKSPKGHQWIECQTDAGTVAFWGGTSTSNLKLLQRRTPPFKVRCGCRQPLPNYPTHAWWVPDGAPIEFIDAAFQRDARTVDDPVREPDPVVVRDEDEERPVRPGPRPVPAPVGSPFRALAREEQRILYVIAGSKTTIWDEDPTGDAGAYVPALYAYRGRMVKEWLASQQRADAEHWLFLSPRYGFIEPHHPIARHDGSFSDKQSGPISDDALRVQVEFQRRWDDRVPLRAFQLVYVWSDSAAYEEKVRTVFELIGARVQRLKALSKART
jgi:hypothetical protein